MFRLNFARDIRRRQSWVNNSLLTDWYHDIPPTGITFDRHIPYDRFPPRSFPLLYDTAPLDQRTLTHVAGTLVSSLRLIYTTTKTRRFHVRLGHLATQ